MNVCKRIDIPLFEYQLCTWSKFLNEKVIDASTEIICTLSKSCYLCASSMLFSPFFLRSLAFSSVRSVCLLVCVRSVIFCIKCEPNWPKPRTTQSERNGIRLSDFRKCNIEMCFDGFQLLLSNYLSVDKQSMESSSERKGSISKYSKNSTMIKAHSTCKQVRGFCKHFQNLDLGEFRSFFAFAH